MKTETRTLYHYCSVDTLIKILESRTIRLSDITKSNDKQEISFLFSNYVSYLKKESPNQDSPKALEYEIKKLEEETDFLVVCFSENRDSLYMWNSYAKGGVCIGFDKEKLKKWASHINVINHSIIYNPQGDYTYASFDKVEYYNKKTVQKYIKSKCTNITFLTEPFGEVYSKTPFSKTNFWAEEKEWRVSVPMKYDIYDIYSYERRLNLSERIRATFLSNREVPLCASCFVPFCPKMISEIVLAPDCKASLSDIKKMLAVYGINRVANIHLDYSQGHPNQYGGEK